MQTGWVFIGFKKEPKEYILRLKTEMEMNFLAGIEQLGI